MTQRRSGPREGRSNVEVTTTDTASLGDDLGFLSGPPKRGDIVRAEGRRGIAEAGQRRARVLQFPDLAQRLTRSPLNYKRPDQWGGYVPPALLAEDAQCIAIDGHAEITLACARDLCGHEHAARRNNSPRRAALVEISAEAWRREHEQVAS